MTPEEKAQELVKSVMEQINLQRLELATRMAEAGMVQDKYIIQDNLLEAIRDFTIPYQCWPELKAIGINV